MNATCAGVLANLKRQGEYLEGFVEGWKELIILLELHKRTTTSTFGTRDSRGPFHQSDFGFDGTRTVTLGSLKYRMATFRACLQSPILTLTNI